MDFQKWDMDLKKQSAKILTALWNDSQMNVISLQSTTDMGVQEKKPRKQPMIIFKLIWRKVTKKLRATRPINQGNSF